MNQSKTERKLLMKKFKKVMAAVMATAAMTISVTSLCISAYSPTITQPFGNGATATLYADTSHASASTSCSGVGCTVTLTYNGTSQPGNSYGYASAYIVGDGSSSSANSYHTAGSYSTSLRF